MISATWTTDVGRASSLVGVDELGRSGESTTESNNFPTLRGLSAGLATWFLEDGGGFLRPDGVEPGLLTEERAVDAPGGGGDEDEDEDEAVEARCSPLTGAVCGEGARDGVVPDAYRFRDDGVPAPPRLICDGPFLFFFFFFPSVKSGFLL